VIFEATCTLAGGRSGTQTTIADGFCDAWSLDLTDHGTCMLTIAVKGFKTNTFAAVSIEKDVDFSTMAPAR
jgi:hypothetical protein